MSDKNLCCKIRAAMARLLRAMYVTPELAKRRQVVVPWRSAGERLLLVLLLLLLVLAVLVLLLWLLLLLLLVLLTPAPSGTFDRLRVWPPTGKSALPPGSPSSVNALGRRNSTLAELLTAFFV